jgi:aspartate/methionine/tyrosine aminotransferase
MKYLVAIPVYNEERHLPDVLDAVRRYAPDILVVDDGSTDATSTLLRLQPGVHTITHPENRGYADNGIAEFKEAATRFMKRELGVDLDPVKEINHCIGSKPALAMLPACFINPGDITLMTVPGYPVAGTHTAYYGGSVYKLRLLAENSFLPDLDSIPAEMPRGSVLIWHGSLWHGGGANTTPQRRIGLERDAFGCPIPVGEVRTFPPMK